MAVNLNELNIGDRIVVAGPIGRREIWTVTDKSRKNIEFDDRKTYSVNKGGLWAEYGTPELIEAVEADNEKWKIVQSIGKLAGRELMNVPLNDLREVERLLKVSGHESRRLRS